MKNFEELIDFIESLNLDEDTLKKINKAIDKMKKDEDYRRSINFVGGNLTEAFTWSRTDEGEEFWRSIDNKRKEE